MTKFHGIAAHLLVLAACGDGAADSSAGGPDTSSGAASGTSEGGPETTADPHPSGSSSDGSNTGDSADSSDSGSDETGPELPPACADEIRLPFVPQGTAISLQAFDAPSKAMIAMDDGGVRVLGGTWRDVLELDGQEFTSSGDDDGFLAVLEPDGSLRWFAPIGGAGGVDVHVDIGPTGDVFVAGTFDTQLIIGDTAVVPDALEDGGPFFAQLDGATGAVVWAHAMSYDSAIKGYGLHVVATPDGGMIASASLGPAVWSIDGEAVIDTSAAAATYLARFDGTGEVVWDAGVFGLDGAGPGVTAIALDGEVAVVAMTALGIGYDAGISLGRDYYASGYQATSLFARYDATGAIEDVEVLPADVTVQAFAMGPCGDVVFGGARLDAIDLGTGTIEGTGNYLARRAADGEMRWVVPLLGENGSVNDVVFDAAGHSTWKTYDGERIEIVRLDSNGGQVWELGFPQVWNYAFREGLVGDGLTQLVLASTFSQQLAVPGLPVVNSQSNHGYVLEIAP